MTEDAAPQADFSAYRTLGLVSNPFVPRAQGRDPIGIKLEMASEANSLLSVLDALGDDEEGGPVLVSKSTEIPSYYHMRAVSEVEASVGNDDSFDMLHAYIQLFMMRLGRIRSTLGIVGERLAFRSFPETVAAWVGRILEEPDESLASYQVLGPDGLASFRERFENDPVATTVEYFGSPAVERRPELAEVTDQRFLSLPSDVDEDADSAELDSAIPDAPGTGVALPEERESAEDQQPIVDYLIEYTKEHLSPVVARGLRIYRERGLAALSQELRVTKAPRKTLSAAASFANERFRKLVILYDGFDNWNGVPPETREKIAESLTEIRSMLAGDAIVVALLERGVVPELEEAFAGGERVEWDFSRLEGLQGEPDALDPEAIDAWLASAALQGAQPLTLADPVLTELLEASDGSLERFATMAGKAIDDAARRGVGTLDGDALTAGLSSKKSQDAQDQTAEASEEGAG